nr:copia protein [Tanacetum cinerariifolium]
MDVKNAFLDGFIDEEADSDHAGDYVDRKSTSSICTFVGCCLTSWFSKKQTALAISTIEAEYVSTEKACQQALWMKQALIDYDVRLDDVPIMCDNKGAIDLSKNPVQHSRNKHIEYVTTFFMIIYKWSIDELVYGAPSEGPYQTNLPSLDDIISFIREDQEGQVTRIRHQEEVESENLERIMAREEVVIPLPPPPLMNHLHLISTMMMMMTMEIMNGPRVQLRFNKYKTAKELWAAILKTFGGNEATKKRKKNILKQQYGNFKAKGTETLEQTFNRLQVISNGSQIKFEDINQIDEDDMEEIDIKWNMALLSMRAEKFWKRTRKKISIQGSDVAKVNIPGFLVVLVLGVKGWLLAKIGDKSTLGVSGKDSAQ